MFELNHRYVRVPAFIAVPAMLAYTVAYLMSVQTVEIVIEDKSAGRHPQAVNQPVPTPTMAFLVYTHEEVFAIDTSALFLEFRPAERYHALKMGRRYRVMVVGWRVPIFHWYRNIVRVVGQDL